MAGTGAGNFASRIRYPPFATWVIATSIHGIADRLSILPFDVVSALVFQNYLQSRKLKKGLTPLNVSSSPPIFFCFEEDAPGFKRAISIEATWKE